GVQSPEFSDEESDFHTDDGEECTSEVEARKQSELNRLFSSMKRELAIAVQKFSSYFSDGRLADSSTRAPVKAQAPCASMEVKHRTLRRVGGFADLEKSVLPTWGKHCTRQSLHSSSEANRCGELQGTPT
ncbi:hypothetical protein PAXRUDRAFT_485502, partial [Paxillus rubicundulus Ve08.2h10]